MVPVCRIPVTASTGMTAGSALWAGGLPKVIVGVQNSNSYLEVHTYLTTLLFRIAVRGF